MAARASTRTLLEGSDGSRVRRTVLPGGLRVITERVPGVRSVSAGVWVGVGSRDESPGQAGAAHFLEHLLFKGTRRRSAWEITAGIEAVGGEMNAFTTKEYTCFYARVLDTDTELAIDVLGDLVTDGLLAPDDIESERAVILEEIAMNEDDAADVVHDVFMAAHFGDTPLGRPILGTQDTIRSLTPRGIRSFYRRRYSPDRTVVAVAGNIEHSWVVERVRRAFAGLAERPLGPAVRGRTARASGAGSTVVQRRPLEQANVVLGLPGITRTDERRYAVAVLNAALGGGMSSRLFQEVREQRGLAYSVYSFVSQFRDSGVVGVYAGCLPGKVDRVVGVVRDVLVDVAEHGLTEDEVARGRGQVRGSVVLGQEDTGARMSRIGKGELLHGEVPSIDEVLARIDAVTPADVADVAADVLAGEPTLAILAPR